MADDFTTRAADLRSEVLAALTEANKAYDDAGDALDAANKRVREAVIAAADLGVRRVDIAATIDRSAAWVNNVVRGERA